VFHPLHRIVWQYPSSASNVPVSVSVIVLLMISAMLTNSSAFSSSSAIASIML